MAGPPPGPNPVELPPTPSVPDLNTLGTLTHEPLRQSILDTIQRLARSPLTPPNADTGPPLAFPVSVPSRMTREHVDSLLHTDYFVYERAIGIRLLMLILRLEDGAPGNQVFLVNASKTIRRVVFPCPDNQNNHHHETLIDGCLVVDRGHNGAPDNLRFLCLDMLSFNGRTDVAAKSLDRRLGMLDMEVIRPHRNLHRLRRTSASALHSPSEAPSAASATANGAVATFPFVLSLQIMERSYGLGKVLDQVIPSLRHACQGLVFAPVRQPFKAGPCVDTYHWIPPRTVTFLVDTVRAGDRIELDLDPRNPHSITDTILTDAMAFKVLARLTNDPEGRLRGVGRVDLDRPTLAAWMTEPPKRRFGVFTWDTYSFSGLSAAGGWKWVRWVAADDTPLADTIDDACRAIEEARNGVPDGLLRAKMEQIRTAWKAREAQQSAHGATLGQNRSASTDQLTSPTAGEFGGHRRRAMSYGQPFASTASTPTSTPSVIPPWQLPQHQQQHVGHHPGSSSSGHRTWAAPSSQPPLSPLGSEFRTRSDSVSAPPSSVPAPVDRIKSPTSPTPSSAAGLPPKPPPLTNQRPRDREDVVGFGPPPPMPPYLGLPRRRSVSESQDHYPEPGGLVRGVKSLRTDEGDDDNRDRPSMPGSGHNGSGPRLPPKPHIVSSDPSKAGGAFASHDISPESTARSPTTPTGAMSDYASSTAAKLRSQPAPAPIPLTRRRSSTGPTSAMLAAVAAATAYAGRKPSPEPQSDPSNPRSRRQSSHGLAIDTSGACPVPSSRSPAQPSSPLRPKTPLAGTRIESHSPKSPSDRNGRGRPGRVSRLSSPNKHTPSPSKGIILLASGEMSDTSSGVPMDLDSNMAVGLGPPSSPDPRPPSGLVVEGNRGGVVQTESPVVMEVYDHGEGVADDMDVDHAVKGEPELQGQQSDSEQGGGSNTSTPHSPLVKTRPSTSPPPTSPQPSALSVQVPQYATASSPPAKLSSSPLRSVPSRPMRHALGIASPTPAVTSLDPPRVTGVPLTSTGIPAPLPPGLAALPRAPSPPQRSQLAALLTTPSSLSSSPVPMPHVPTPPLPPHQVAPECSTPATSSAPAAQTGGGRKRKQPVSNESSPSMQVLPPSKPKRSRKGSTADAVGTLSPTDLSSSAMPTAPIATLAPAIPSSTALDPAKAGASMSHSLLFGPSTASQCVPAPSNGPTAPPTSPPLTESATPAPPLRINTSLATVPPVSARPVQQGSAPVIGSTSSLPSAHPGRLSHSGSQSSVLNATKMSFSFLLNDGGDDAMDTSPDASPVRPSPPSLQAPPMTAPVTATNVGRPQAASSGKAPSSKPASRRSDFDHEMTDEDVAALLTSMQSPSNVRPATTTSSANQSRQPTPRSASSASQPPFPAPPQNPAIIPAQRRSQQPPTPVTAMHTSAPLASSVPRQHSGASTQPPTPRQQSFQAASMQQQAHQQMQQQHRRLSTASTSEHAQMFPQGYPPTPGGPPPPNSRVAVAHGPGPQHPGHPSQYPGHVPGQNVPQQHAYRPPPVMSPKAYHFTMNPANMPGSPTSAAPPSHSPTPVTYAHDPRAPPSAPVVANAPPGPYPPYGYQGAARPPGPYQHGYPPMQQPPTMPHYQHGHVPQAHAHGQYQQQMQQQHAAQVHAQYLAAMQQQQQQQQQQQHAVGGYHPQQADPYGRRPSYPGPNPQQPPLPPGYPAPPGPR